MRGRDKHTHETDSEPAHLPVADDGSTPPIPAPWGGDIYTGRQAEEAARQHDDYHLALTSMHRSCREAADWAARAAVTAPPAPRPSHTHEKRAQKALNNYRPGAISRLLGRVGAERRVLLSAVAEGRALDERLFAAGQEAHAHSLQWHGEAVDLARRVLAGEAAAFKQAISLADPLMAIGCLGQRASFTALNPGAYAVRLYLRAGDVIPEQRVRLLASGRVAVQDFPPQEACRLLRDHVCSAVLRAARELFALLPLNELLITAIEDTPALATGANPQRTLIRFRATRRAIEYVDFQHLDSLEAMQKLWHRADFEGTGKLHALVPEFENSDMG